jgi:hypothetical protein
LLAMSFLLTAKSVIAPLGSFCHSGLKFIATPLMQ